jgi:hypothetical protein
MNRFGSRRQALDMDVAGAILDWQEDIVFLRQLDDFPCGGKACKFEPMPKSASCMAFSPTVKPGPLRRLTLNSRCLAAE